MADTTFARYLTDQGLLATSFQLGHVAPDGSIWMTPTERMKSGVLQIPEAELEKAEAFGWTKVASDTPGYVHVRRA